MAAPATHARGAAPGLWPLGEATSFDTTVEIVVRTFTVRGARPDATLRGVRSAVNVGAAARVG